MGQQSIRKVVAGAVAVLATGGVALSGTPASGQTSGPDLGSFSAPVVEPTINGKPTAEKCLPKEKPEFNRDFDCKPAAGSINTLPNGETFYWDALEGTENVENSIVAEYGSAAVNDMSRILRFVNGLPTWETPTMADGGANPNGNDPNTTPLIPGTGTNEPGNSGALFCADQNFLADGKILAAGGTDYLNDPGVEGAPVGATELAGVSATRIYDPATKSWSQTDNMDQGRWYPTLVTQGNGKMFVASGLEKLIKPVNNSGSSGGNVRETETFDPQKMKWEPNGTKAPTTGINPADRSLPLFPRLHLLPNGNVYYNAAGQSFNPFGQDYAEAQWNVAASYDTKAQTWNELGVPGATTGATTAPGFRGSTSSTMLPLKPNPDGSYTKASFLTAGGVLNPPSPGGYIAVAQSQIATVDTADRDKLTTEETGPLAEGRWYGSQILLPTGEVVTFSGSDRDEVVAPGIEIPVRNAELFDPKTKTWRQLAEANNLRTYHNSASLLPDGRVMVAGHAPISTLYGKNQTLASGTTGPNDGRDPSFEIFSPPYMARGDRPEIASVSVDGAPATACPTSGAYGKTFTMATRGGPVESVVLVRFGSQTHVVDGDQRSVELPIVAQKNGSVTVKLPDNRDALPPGPYMLFTNKSTPKGLVPSVSKTMFVGAPVPPSLACAAAGKGAPAPAPTSTACASKVGFQSVDVKRRGRKGLRVGFTRVGEAPVDVDVFQHATGRRIVRERLVARFSGKTRSFDWNGKANRRGRAVRDGYYSVRYTTRTRSGQREVRRIAMRRSGGRFTARPDFYRRVTCDVLKAFKLKRPAFGGPKRTALGIAFRLTQPARVSVVVRRGGRVVKRFETVTSPRERSIRLTLPAKGRPRGDYRVTLTATPSNGPSVTSTLTSRRL